MGQVGKLVGLAVIALTVLAPAAQAATITVNSNADTIGDTGTCTLREAIVAANTNTASGMTAGECASGAPGADEILFANIPMGFGSGQVGNSTITSSGLPAVTEDLAINAGTVGPIFKPRIGIRVSPVGSADALTVSGGAELNVTGLAITNADAGIDASDGVLTASLSWFGLSLDQNLVGGNAVGIELGSDSVVGDPASIRPNVFVANGIGLRVSGGDDNLVQRSFFGAKNDGTTLMGAERNGVNVRVVDDAAGPDPATGNVVGVADVTNPDLCDLGCNLISNAIGDGLDLRGTGGVEGPASGPTTVRGNFIGTTINGVNDLGNGGVGVAGGSNTTIGGTGAGEGNLISFNEGDAIQVLDPGVTNVVIRANTGRDNGSVANDLFIDLGADGLGNTTVNGAIQAPGVTSATATQIQGTSAEADGTVVDVYRTFIDRGGIRDRLGQTTVIGGAWTFVYPFPLGPGACVTASQTETATPKGTSELAPTTTIGGGLCDTTPPSVMIVSGPPAVTDDPTPTFGFSASDPGSSFECSIDMGPFAGCPNPYTTPELDLGDHTLAVRATNPAGDTGPDVSQAFEVVAPAPPPPPPPPAQSALTPSAGILATPITAPAAIKRCRKNQKLRKGRCVRKKRRKR